MGLSVYIASSWRNKLQPEILATLRADGHSCYDFKNPAPGDTGFGWRQIGDRFGKCARCGEEDPLKKPGWCPLGTGRLGPTSVGHAPNSHEAHDWVGGWDATFFATEVLDHPISKRGFDFDMTALKAASAVVLVQPCGRSAHLELGYAVGQGKLTVVYYPELDEPELMVRMCDYVVSSVDELRKVLSLNRPPPRWQADVEEFDAAGMGSWYQSAPPAIVAKETFARPGEVIGPCRPGLHRICKGCKSCWRHGACTCVARSLSEAM